MFSRKEMLMFNDEFGDFVNDDTGRDEWDGGMWDMFIDEYHCTDYWVDTDALMDEGAFEDDIEVEEEDGDCG
jgi:hypothetical protein